MGVKQGILPFQAFSLFNIFISPIEFNPFLKFTIFMLDWHSFRWHKISIPTATKFSKTCLATTISVLVAKKKTSLFFLLLMRWYLFVMVYKNESWHFERAFSIPFTMLHFSEPNSKTLFCSCLSNSQVYSFLFALCIETKFIWG